MAITVNGMIAKEDDDTSFVSDNSWENFDQLSRKAGNLITGRRTHEIDVAEGYFPYPDRLNIIMTNKPIENKWGEKTIFSNKTAKEVLKLLEEKGFDTAFIAGGAKIATSFMKENLVDEIYVDVEPIAIGKGIRLFSEEEFEAKLELIEVKNLSKNEIQLHYRVLK
jgi:dihydrofolate reductase